MSIQPAWIKVLPAALQTRIADNPQLQRIVSNIGWLLFDKAVRLGSVLLVGIWMARYLGPEQFGTYNYALAFAALFAPLVGLGLDQIVVRELVCHPQQRDELLATALWLKLAGAVLAVSVTIAAVFLLRPAGDAARLMVVIISASMAFQAFDVVDLWFQSQVQAKYAVWARNAAVLVSAAVRGALVLAEAPLIAFAWVVCVEFGLIAAGLVACYWWQQRRWFAHGGSLALATRLLRESWPLILSSLAIMVYMKIDQVMLGQMIGDSAVGIYGAAARISEVWYVVPTAIVSSLAPMLMRLRQQHEQEYYRRLQQLFRLMTAVGYAVALPITVVALPLVTLLYGQAYRAAGPVLAVHVWAGVFVALGVARGVWITTEGLMLFAFVSTATSALINVGLNLLLIPQYGPMGAAIATLLSYMSAILLVCFIYQPTRKIGWMLVRSLGLQG